MKKSLPAPAFVALLLGVFCCAMLALYPQLSSTAATASSAREIEQLIKDLGSAHFETRETATRALMERGDAAAALYKALSSPDAEVRRRATYILKELESKRARRALARARALGKDGRVVEIADQVVYWREWDKDGEGWDALTQFADKLMERAARDVFLPGFSNLWKRPGLPAGDFRRYKKATKPREISGRKLAITYAGIILVRGEQVSVEGSENPGIEAGIVAASENIQINKAAYSLIVAGGNVKVGCLMDSILVCDGDIELFGPPDGGLIIARGKVTCRHRELTGCVIRSENFYQFRDGKKIVIKDGTPDPLAFVKFFELSDVGLTASDRDHKNEPVRDGVWLKDIRKGSPFAAGLRAGDVVTALDGAKATSKEVFRRLLRRKLAQGGPILTFTVRRGKATLDVPIPVKD